MTTKALPSGTDIVSSYAYDDADRLTGISHVKGGITTLSSVAYTLDDVGNRTQRVDQQGTHTYVYDDLYRLVEVTYPGPSTTEYTFDAFGNRETMTDGSGTTDYSYDDADRLTEVDPPLVSPVAWTWDDNGNLTDRGADEFVWDEADRMVSATVSSAATTFAYRGDGLRHSRTTVAGTTTFTWDVNAGLPVVLHDGNYYVYGGGLEAMEQSGDWYYYLEDGLGSTHRKHVDRVFKKVIGDEASPVRCSPAVGSSSPPRSCPAVARGLANTIPCDSFRPEGSSWGVRSAAADPCPAASVCNERYSRTQSPPTSRWMQCSNVEPP